MTLTPDDDPKLDRIAKALRALPDDRQRAALDMLEDLEDKDSTPIERVPHDLLVPAIRDVESTVRTLSQHLEERHRPRVAAMLRSLADDVDRSVVEPDATPNGERQLPLFG